MAAQESATKIASTMRHAAADRFANRRLTIENFSQPSRPVFLPCPPGTVPSIPNPGVRAYECRSAGASVLVRTDDPRYSRR